MLVPSKPGGDQAMIELFERHIARSLTVDCQEQLKSEVSTIVDGERESKEQRAKEQRSTDRYLRLALCSYFAGSVFRKSIPEACWPTSTVATVLSARRSITSTVPGSEPIPSTVTNA